MQTDPRVFTDDDRRFMRLALDLSKNAEILSAPNPSVGCVIVKDGRVIGQGYTQAAGADHAEVSALKDAVLRGECVQGSTVYVTLEPCSHYGRTPPCALALIRHGIARAVVAAVDPNKLVSGKGVRMLREAGIRVDVGLMREQALYANRSFFKKMQTGRPWVRLKIAMSLDARTALSNGMSQWITSEEARFDARRSRAHAGIVMTGCGTVLRDNPQMTARLGESGAHEPLRMVLDTSMRVSPDAKIFSNSGAIWCVAHEDLEKMERLGGDVEIWRLPERRGRLDLDVLMDRIAETDCNEVMLEAGGTLSGAMLEAGYVDEIQCYLAPKILGPGREGFVVPAIENLALAKQFRIEELQKVGSDAKITLLRGD